MSWIKEAWIKYEEILPNYDDVFNVVIKELAEVYKDFIERGEFYRTKGYGCRVSIVEDDGVSGEPYKTIGDWCEELTGNMGSNWIPESFEERLVEIAEDELKVYEVDIDNDDALYERFPDFESDRGMIVMEFVGEVEEVSIDELEKRIKVL